jgi:hypothetical protein
MKSRRQAPSPKSLWRSLATGSTLIFCGFAPRTLRTRFLDVGVSNVVGDAASVIDRRYPAQDKITAVGSGQGNAFKVSFPQIQYRQIIANQALPFGDQSFDVVTANAFLARAAVPP